MLHGERGLVYFVYPSISSTRTVPGTLQVKNKYLLSEWQALRYSDEQKQYCFCPHGADFGRETNINFKNTNKYKIALISKYKCAWFYESL